ncbi:hypothetical protein VE02_03478 [Pseudogymnoascus sp. 03VT05]|nr:hypothetical protein VE02_03478 [Pseudogymnoascus sp. 03VT05]
MSEKPTPKTITMGLTKTLADGSIISRHHPNPNGITKAKKPYRSLKNERTVLLPQSYTPRNSNPQNGDFQCPVLECEKAFTRRAGVINHMQRPNGHADDLLRDEGDGTFSIINPALNDMRQGHAEPEAPDMQSYESQGQPGNKPSSVSDGEDIYNGDQWLKASDGGEGHQYQFAEAAASDGEEMHGYEFAEAAASDGEEMHGYEFAEAAASDREEVLQHQPAVSADSDAEEMLQHQPGDVIFEDWQIWEEFDNVYLEDID